MLIVVNIVIRKYFLTYTKKRNVKALNTRVIKIDLIAVLTFILSIDIIESLILQNNHDGLHNSISSYLGLWLSFSWTKISAQNLHWVIVRRGEFNVSEIKNQSDYKYIMVKSVASYHHFVLVFVVSTERNYGKISWFSSSKLRRFAFFLAPVNLLNQEIIIQKSRNLDYL